MSFNNQCILMSAAAGIIIVLTLFVISQWRSKNSIEYSTKKRIVRFKQNAESTKFRRREPRYSLHVDKAVVPFSLYRSGISTTAHKDIDPRFAFMIRNVLSPDECGALIVAAEQTGFEQRQYSGNGEDSASCCFESITLTNKIFTRIMQHLPHQSYSDADCMWSFIPIDECQDHQ